MRLLAVLPPLLWALPAAAGLPKADLAGLGIDPPPGARAPLDLRLRDEAGRAATPGGIMAGRPALLLLADYTCRTMCGAATTALADDMGRIEGLRAGRDYAALVVGLDPKDGPAEAAAAKARELAAFPAATAAALPFLSGGEAEVGALTRAIGYRDAFDAEADQFAHPSGVVVLAPDGRVTGVLDGIGQGPDALRSALVAAGEGRVGTLAERVRLLCYGAAAAVGIHGAAVSRSLSAAAAATLLGLGGFVLALRRRRRAGGEA
jgi:protein SCO1/2